MLNTFERDLIANQRHEELLREFARHRLIEQATDTVRTTGLLATLAARLRGMATAARTASANAARA